MIELRSCPLCGFGGSLRYYDLGAPGRITIHNRICAKCGLVFQSPRPHYNDLAGYYAEYMEKNQPGIADIPTTFEEHVMAIARLRLRFLSPFLSEGARVIDIGCSFGATLKVLRDESGVNLEVVGVNPEERLAKLGRSKYGLDIRVGMFEEQSFEEQAFDIVILDNVLEHMNDIKGIMQAIHRLLSDSGKVFIATINLDEPHGFLWQNFFLDHTVTFSPNTLQVLLESHGFKILAVDQSGHVTYEGYHYPYQCVMAEKTTVPKRYDFRQAGDSADRQIQKAQTYIKSYYRGNRTGKLLYEMGLEKSPRFKTTIKKTVLKLWRRLNGAPDFVIRNHTLPPEEYFRRRVLVSECATDNDVGLTYALAAKSRLNPIIVILRNQTDSGLVVQTCPEGIVTNPFPASFTSRAQLWRCLLDNAKRIDEGISLRLDNSDLRDDTLIRLYAVFQKSGKDYILADFRQFTQARFEFIRAGGLQKIDAALPVQESNLLPTMDKSESDSLIIWPQRPDYYYYFKERFEQYYAVPKSISLDLSPMCNKKCDKCQFHSPRSPHAHLIAGNRLMSKELAFRILNDAATWTPKPAIAPTFSGEPLIYPHLYEVLKYAKDLGFPVGITTNGLALNEEQSMRLLDLEVDTLLISLDAAQSDTYAVLQAPGDLAVVHNNIIRFLKLRGSKRPPFVGVHFCMEERNKLEFPDYLAYWGDKVDFVSRAIRQDMFSNCQCVLPHWFPMGRTQACHGAWTALFIRWNGDVSFCGFDIDGESSGLNFPEKSLAQIWNSPEYWRWRAAQLDGDRSILYCKACPCWVGCRTKQIREDTWEITRTPITESYKRVAHRISQK